MAIFNSYVKLPKGICRKDRQGEEGQGFWANGEIDEDTKTLVQCIQDWPA